MMQLIRVPTLTCLSRSTIWTSVLSFSKVFNLILSDDPSLGLKNGGSAYSRPCIGLDNLFRRCREVKKKKNIFSLLTLIDRGLLGWSDLRSNRHRLESASKLRKSGLQPIIDFSTFQFQDWNPRLGYSGAVLHGWIIVYVLNVHLGDWLYHVICLTSGLIISRLTTPYMYNAF